MRILQAITLADLGGAQSVLINLCECLINDGHEVIVVSGSEGPMWDILSGKVEKIRIKSLNHSIRLCKDFEVILQLHKIYRQYKPDVIHLHSSKMGLLGRVAFPKSKIVYTVHGFDSIRVAYRKFLFIEKLLSGRARNVVGVSRYDYNHFISEKMNTKNISYIYNGTVDYSQKTAKHEDAVKQTIHELKSKYCFLVLSIARLSSQKRFDLFCETALLLKSQNIAFIWIGNQYQPENLPANVYCMGSIKNAYQYIPFVNLCILPSNYEGLPVSIIESLVFGKPVIASDVGGISEILDGSNGFALKNDPELFADRILFYIHNKDAYDLACQTARKTYEDKFTVKQMYEKYLSLYQNINNVKK
jgi:glycosyltransferase involved in cell wall biosynthesis